MCWALGLSLFLRTVVNDQVTNFFLICTRAIKDGRKQWQQIVWRLYQLQQQPLWSKLYILHLKYWFVKAYICLWWSISFGYICNIDDDCFVILLVKLTVGSRKPQTQEKTRVVVYTRRLTSYVFRKHTCLTWIKYVYLLFQYCLAYMYTNCGSFCIKPSATFK